MKKKRERWVVKVGSQMVRHGGAVIIRAWMDQILSLKRNHNIEVIWVSSGAISSAVMRTDFKKTKKDWQLSEKQALSAIGQPILMDLYNIALQATGQLGSQILLTASDLKDKKRRENFKRTLEQLLEWNVIPILNENDAIATEEIKFGDNDSLSAQVARFVKASKLVILTDVEGLFDIDPRENPAAKLVISVDRVTPSVLKLAGKGGSAVGTGGMFSKISAAREAANSGIDGFLVKGDRPHVLEEIAQGALVGTHIKRHKKRRS